MKLILISDTHGQHHNLKLPEGDMLIHAGDISRMGKEEQVKEFLLWFSKQPHTHKIFIAGNHDFFFEKQPNDVAALIPDNCIYLNDSGVTIEGIKIWGSPITPWFFDWAFNCHRGEAIRQYWDKIPEDTDILITHGPPYGILDKTSHGKEVGCEELIKVIEIIKPKIHVFGHIHEGYGIIEQNGTQFINASVLNEHYKMINEPVIINL